MHKGHDIQDKLRSNPLLPQNDCWLMFYRETDVLQENKNPKNSVIPTNLF